MNERIIQVQVYSLFQNYEYKLFNTYMFAWESDFFAISKSGYSVEVEVKISRSDFKADEKKIEKHLMLNNHKADGFIRSKHPFEPYINYHQRNQGITYNPDTWEYKTGDHSYFDVCCVADHIPNKFYYAVPEGLIGVAEVPKWAGLIYIKTHLPAIDSKGNYMSDKPSYTYYVAKQAPFLHKKKVDHKASLLSKYYYKHHAIKADVFDFISGVRHLLDDYQKQSAEALKKKFY